LNLLIPQTAVAGHLACARDCFHCLLDGELFIPESWSDDRERCRSARTEGVPMELCGTAIRLPCDLGPPTSADLRYVPVSRP
jgi:hypothetical protein